MVVLHQLWQMHGTDSICYVTVAQLKSCIAVQPLHGLTAAFPVQCMLLLSMYHYDTCRLLCIMSCTVSLLRASKVYRDQTVMQATASVTGVANMPVCVADQTGILPGAFVKLDAL